jgi:hypothetical protein
MQSHYISLTPRHFRARAVPELTVTPSMLRNICEVAEVCISSESITIENLEF